MAESFDIAFAKAAVTHELITAEQSAKLALVQAALTQQKIAKLFAQIAVEGGWIDRDHAESIVDELNTARPNSHPDLVVVQSSLPLEGLAQQGVTGDDAVRVEAIRTILEAAGFARSFGELASDLGLVLMEAEPDRALPRSGTKTTSRVGQTDPTKRKQTEIRSERPTAVRNRDSRIREDRPTALRPAPAPAPAPSRGTSVRTKAPDPTKSSSSRTKAPVLPERGTSVRPAPKKQNKALILGAAGGGAALLLVVLVVMATRTNPAAKPVDNTSTPSTAAATKPPDKRDPPAKVERKPPPPDIDPDATFKKEQAEQREKAASQTFTDAQTLFNDEKFKDAANKLASLKQMFAGTKFLKDNENSIEGLLTDATRRTPPDAVPDPVVKPAEKKDLAALKADYEKQKSARLVGAQKRIEDMKKAIEADRAAEKTKMADLLKRVSDKKLPLVLKSGLKLNNAAITQLSRDNAKLNFESEGAQVEMEIPWEALDDKSYLALQKAIHSADGAKGWYEIGRQAITRKLWKDAKAAFDECKKQDGAFGDRCPNLDPIINNQGAFKGASKRIGKETLVLTYDWSDDDQREDFKPAQDWKVGGGSAVITPRGRSLSSLKEVDFEGELSIDAQVTIDEKAQLIIGCFWNGLDRKAYFLHLGATGAQLFRWDGSEPTAPTAKKDGKITGDVALRFSVRGGSWKVTANGTEVFSTTDATHTKGWMYFGAMGGSVTFKKVTITGKASPTELDKIFAETEVLVRRALEGDLRPKKPDEKDERDIVISIEHEYFLSQISDNDRSEFDRAKQKILKAMHQGGWRDIRDLMGTNSVFAFLEGVIRNNPNFRAANYWRGMAYQLWGRGEQARKDYLEACKEPDCFEARHAMGEAYFSDIKFEKAEYYVAEALKLAPDYAPAIGLKAFLKFIGGCDHKELQRGTVSGDVKSAMADFEIALKLDPEDDDILERQKNLLNVIKGPKHLGCKYTVESAHYIVMTDISPEKTKLYSERLEAAYTYYKETFKEFFKEEAKALKPRIAIFNTREAYMTYGELTLGRRQDSTLGYFHPMYRELLLFEDVDLDDTLQTMYHEAFHQFMNMMIPRCPYWYNEGIAEYMGAITVEKGKVVKKAGILDGRLKGLKMSLKQAFPFDNIMNQSPGEFYAGPVSFKYAQAWSMVHFFYEYEGGKYRKLIDTYYKALLEGKETREAFDAAFGAEDLKELKKQWTAYVEKMEPGKK